MPELPADKMVFHLCGDTGGLLSPQFKHRVAAEMIKQCHAAASVTDRPAFFFHLGDVVYNFGQAREYHTQFFSPYELYPAPIFAIAGNHDADVDPTDPVKPKSLDAFMEVFCNSKVAAVSFSGGSKRHSQTQPNVYYTLKTPLANIICLYSNVPRFGHITNQQRDWFIEELKRAAAERDAKAVIVCLHHSAYSADTNHGSSIHMQRFLASAFEEANAKPDIVFSGHVHNYQRFSKRYPDGKLVPFVISGAGGFADLHPIARLNDPAFPDTSSLLDHVRLENYCDDKHGFLKITIEKNDQQFTLTGEYYTIPPVGNEGADALVYDSFVIELGGMR